MSIVFERESVRVFMIFSMWLKSPFYSCRLNFQVVSTFFILGIYNEFSKFVLSVIGIIINP